MSTKLMPDAQAPALSLPLVGGGTWTLAERTPEAFAMIVVYRGLHCPICKTYLGKLNGMMGEAAGYGLDVVAVSMDGEDRAQEAKTDWGLDALPVAHGLSEDDARAWGLYMSQAIREGEADLFAEPGLFWVRPDGRLYLIDIASMPFARPDLELLLPKAKMATEKDYPRGTHPL